MKSNPNRTSRRGVLAVACAMVALVVAAPAGLVAMCCPFPCPDCWIETAGQSNLVVVDRDKGMVHLVPNIVIRGMAQDFALIVPTPSEPQFGEVDRAIWAEARALTAPVFPTSNSGGCSENNPTRVSGGDSSAEDPGVVVVRNEVVGAFQVTVLSSTDAQALVTWLTDNNFVIGDNAPKLEPYVQRGWFFTAMKLDSSDPANQMPVNGWNAEVNPVEISYAATEFEVPFPILSINRVDWMPMVFYVIDDFRTALDDFDTLYANRLSSNEARAIQRQHANLGRYVRSGRYFTMLSKTFIPADLMDESGTLARAATDREFRRGLPQQGGIPAEPLVVLMLLTLLRRQRLRA